MAKWKRVAIGVVLVGAIAGFVALRTANADEPKILGHPFEYAVLARANFNAKPWIDMRLPIFGQVTIPKADPKMKKIGAEVRAFDARIPGVIYSQTNEHIGFFRWQVEGQFTEGQARMRRDSWLPLPFVYGTKPKVGLYYATRHSLPVKIQLPANGQPIPVIPSQTVVVGGRKVTFRPRPVVSPSIPIFVDVLVEGTSASTEFLLTFRQDMELLVGSQPATICFTEMPIGPLEFEICRAEFKMIGMLSSVREEASKKFVTLTMEDGKQWLSAELEEGKSPKVKLAPVDGIITCGSISTGPDFAPERRLDYRLVMQPRSFHQQESYFGLTRMRDGEKVRASMWSFTERARGSVHLDFPRENPYEGAVYSDFKRR